MLGIGLENQSWNFAEPTDGFQMMTFLGSGLREDRYFENGVDGIDNLSRLSGEVYIYEGELGYRAPFFFGRVK